MCVQACACVHMCMCVCIVVIVDRDEITLEMIESDIQNTNYYSISINLLRISQ